MDLFAVKKLANELMQEHGLTQLGWTLQFDNSVKRFGVCRHQPKVIGLSKPLCSINDEVQVKDTILHEMAHALVGRGHGHDNVWKRMCVEIGAKPQRCYKREEISVVDLRYQAICGGCGKKHQRAKRVPENRRRACLCQRNKSWEQKEVLIYKDTRLVYQH